MKFERGKTYWCIYCPGSWYPVVKPWQGVYHKEYAAFCTVQRIVPVDETVDDFFQKSNYNLTYKHIFHTEAEAQESYIKHERVRLEIVRDKAIRDLEKLENEV